MMTLFSYWRSSTAYRARIGLNLKGLPHTVVPVHLVRGEHRAEDYRARNPQGIVPTLEDGPHNLGQSLAILEYLDDAYPNTPPLLPADPVGRARVRAFAQAIACEVHPLNNLRVLKYLTETLGVGEEAKTTWYHHWTILGLEALEAMVANSPLTGQFVHGDTPGLADACLVPQMYNARRFHVPLEAYPTLCRLDDACRALPAFAQAAPEEQPDAEG